MYRPDQFKEDRVEVLHGAIREIGLATLITLGPGGLVASHIPMLVDPDPAPLGTLYGHVARANPQWRDLSAAPPALAVFLGPATYVSPSSYPTKAETGRVVPTWNYVAVHAYGPLRAFEDPDRLLALVTRLTDAHEARLERPWRVTDAPAGYVRGLLGAIVGLELPVARLEGTWKMSQNRPEADRLGVVEALRGSLRPGDRDVAELVASRLAEERKERG